MNSTMKIRESGDRGYEQKAYTLKEKTNQLKLVASPDGAEGSVMINQEVRIYASILETQATVVKQVTTGHGIWEQVVQGKLSLNNEILENGDGAAVEDIDELTLTGIEKSEVLLFDLA